MRFAPMLSAGAAGVNTRRSDQPARGLVAEHREEAAMRVHVLAHLGDLAAARLEQPAIAVLVDPAVRGLRAVVLLDHAGVALRDHLAELHRRGLREEPAVCPRDE